MGQKVHPTGFRLGVIKDWSSRWYASDKRYREYLMEDHRIRELIKKRWYNAGISKIEIERVAAEIVRIIVHAARPGLVIGKKGVEIEGVKRMLAEMTSRQVYISVKEVPIPEIDAQLVAENIASQIERRVAFRRAMKQAVSKAMRLGAKGIKIACSGRLGGAEIARTEWYLEGRLPLQTLRADIDYGFAEAFTTYGQIGIKVWIFKGEVLPQKKEGETHAEVATKQ
ncbi:MAG: 30S ribosomal protein S3 [Synergistetes bacterium]|nr:30S ribosomal protein S3 [Synergistota bacterium]